MSSNTPPGYGPPQEPNPYGQNPYGQQPPASGYGYPQGQQQPPAPGYGYPQGQQPGYGAPQGGWPGWLGTTPPGVPPTPGVRVLASFGERFLARLIDWAILLIPSYIVMSIAGLSLIYSVMIGVLYFAYDAALMLTQHGQTVGKKVMKLRVVSVEHGGRPADNAFWIRAAVWGGPLAVYCLGDLFAILNGLWQLWDKPLQQSLSDKAAKTVVVKEN